MKNNEITIVAAKALPGLASESLTYNAEHNLWLTMGWTSNAGNTYLKAYRMCKGLAIAYNIGIGYCRTFLNGITIFAFDGERPRMIASGHWGGCCNWMNYSDYNAKSVSARMLGDYLVAEAKRLGQPIQESEARAYAESVINQTSKKELTILK